MRIPTVEIMVDGRRKIVNADDPRAVGGTSGQGSGVTPVSGHEQVTRESIVRMRKSDVRELLEAHGAETSGNVAEMRQRLTRVMFVEL